MKQYLELMKEVLDKGASKGDRTGTGTYSVFARQLRFDLSEGFPLLTTKKLHLKSIVNELIWFLNGNTNIKWLNENGVKIWNEWANEEGEVGPNYGHFWTKWPTKDGGHINQIEKIVEQLKTNPDSRRILFHAWNVEYLPDESLSAQENVSNGKMALPPCHLLYQFYVENNKLSCQLYIRSSDVFLGLSYNVASVSLLINMLAQQCDLDLGEVIITTGDTHLYKNHIDQAKLQLTREVRKLPTLKILRKPSSIFDYNFEDFEIEGYDPHPNIPAPVAV